MVLELSGAAAFVGAMTLFAKAVKGSAAKGAGSGAAVALDGTVARVTRVESDVKVLQTTVEDIRRRNEQEAILNSGHRERMDEGIRHIQDTQRQVARDLRDDDLAERIAIAVGAAMRRTA